MCVESGKTTEEDSVTGRHESVYECQLHRQSSSYTIIGLTMYLATQS